MKGQGIFILFALCYTVTFLLDWAIGSGKLPTHEIMLNAFIVTYLIVESNK